MTDTRRPRLVPHARLQADRVGGGQVLLFPEGILRLNATSAAILELCDGERGCSELIDELQRRYPAGVDIPAAVTAFLVRLQERGLVQLSPQEVRS